MKGTIISGVVLPIALLVLFGWGAVGDKQNATSFESVEVGVAELSPAGEKGGYAIPASGGSAGSLTCELSFSQATMDVDTVEDQEVSITLSPDPNRRMWARIYHDVNKNKIVEATNAVPNSRDRNWESYYREEGGTSDLPDGDDYRVFGDSTYDSDTRVIDHTAWLPQTSGEYQAGEYMYTAIIYGQDGGTSCYHEPGKGTICGASYQWAHCSATITLESDEPYDVRGTGAVPVGDLTPGNRLTFNGWIENEGVVDITTTFDNRFQIDENANGTVDHEIYESYMDIDRLDWGQVEKISSAPDGGWPNVPAGEHRVRVCADWSNTIAESRENNCSGWNTFEVREGDFADLEAVAVIVHPDDVLRVGEPTRFRGTVTNNSQIVAATDFWDSFQYSLASGTGPWTNFTNVNHPSGLAAGSSAFDVTSGLTFSNPGTVYVRYCVDTSSDVAQTVEESNEANNCIVESFIIASTGPQVDRCEVSPNPAEINQNVEWVAKVKGGIGPYTFQWNGPGFNRGDDSTTSNTEVSVTKRYSSAGTKSVQVKVTDANNATSGFQSCEVLTVNDPTPTGPPDVDLLIDGGNHPNQANALEVNPSQQVTLAWTVGSGVDRCDSDFFSGQRGTSASERTETVTVPSDLGYESYLVRCWDSSDANNKGTDTDWVEVTEASPLSGPPVIDAVSPVDYGTSSSVTWELRGNTNCSIRGNNGDTVGSNPLTSDSPSGGVETTPLFGQTTYTIQCDGASAEKVINVRRQYIEE